MHLVCSMHLGPVKQHYTKLYSGPYVSGFNTENSLVSQELNSHQVILQLLIYIVCPLCSKGENKGGGWAFNTETFTVHSQTCNYCSFLLYQVLQLPNHSLFATTKLNPTVNHTVITMRRCCRKKRKCKQWYRVLKKCQ